MARIRKKTFTILDVHHFTKIDSWWAGLLHKGPKEIVDLKWESHGDLNYQLSVYWQPVDQDFSLNVGLPAYTDFTTEELLMMLEDVEGHLLQIKADQDIITAKLHEWGVSQAATFERITLMGYEGEVETRLRFRPEADEAEKYIVCEFLWPQAKLINKAYAMCKAKIAELQREIESRESADYFIVEVDRGRLRQSFTEQVGFDNEWLFDEDSFFREES